MEKIGLLWKDDGNIIQALNKIYVYLSLFKNIFRNKKIKTEAFSLQQIYQFLTSKSTI